MLCEWVGQGKDQLSRCQYAVSGWVRAKDQLARCQYAVSGWVRAKDQLSVCCKWVGQGKDQLSVCCRWVGQGKDQLSVCCVSGWVRARTSCPAVSML